MHEYVNDPEKPVKRFCSRCGDTLVQSVLKTYDEYTGEAISTIIGEPQCPNYVCRRRISEAFDRLVS